jgi:hypothetical protein
LGSAAQGSYAAANAALDALAVRRRRLGLAATSLAWGTFAEVGLAARLDEALQGRLRRAGLVPIDAEMGMQLLDEALGHPAPALVPVHFDRTALQRLAHERPEVVPPLLRSFLGTSMRRAATASVIASSALAERISRLPAAEREEAILETVRTQVAAVLGLASPELAPVDRPLRELGLDSLMAVEARNRLSQVVGEALPTSLLFNHPTISRMAKWLSQRLSSTANAQDVSEDSLMAVISRAVANSSVVQLTELGILQGLCRIANVSEPAALVRNKIESPGNSAQLLDAQDHMLDDVLDDLARTMEGFDE